MSCFASLKDCAAAFKDTAAYSVNPNGYTAIEGLLFWVTRVRSHLASGLDEVPEELAFDCHSAHFLYDVEKVCFHTELRGFIISLTTCHSAKTLLLKRAKANDGVKVGKVSSPASGCD